MTAGNTKALPAWGRAVSLLPLVGIGTGIALGVSAWLALLADPQFTSRPGWDFAIYRDAAARWLGGGFFYYPEQVAGPYTTLVGHVMYPPPALTLFVPFTVLPAILWWAIPLGIIAWRLAALRPSPWGWAAIALLAGWPMTQEMVLSGNPSIWIAAALALASRWPALSALVFIKPSLFPLAFGGVRDRWWWAVTAAGLGVALLFAPMWPDWFRAVLNARGEFSGPLYSLRDLPMVLIPVVGWATRTAGAAGTGFARSR